MFLKLEKHNGFSQLAFFYEAFIDPYTVVAHYNTNQFTFVVGGKSVLSGVTKVLTFTKRWVENQDLR